MVVYKYCPECAKPYKCNINPIGFTICPFCGAGNSYVINRKQYERERYKVFIHE